MVNNNIVHIFPPKTELCEAPLGLQPPTQLIITLYHTYAKMSILSIKITPGDPGVIFCGRHR